MEAKILGFSKKKIFPNFYSLPMMFGSNLKKQIEPRCLADAFVGYLAGIRRLGKKIGSRKISHFHQKSKNFRHPIFLPSLPISAEQPTNASATHLVPTFEDRFFLNIIGNE
jgi:hypothetical protein